MPARAAIPVEALEEQLSRRPPEGEGVRLHDGDARVEQVAQLDVIEGHHGHVPGPLARAERAERADGDEVLAGEAGRGRHSLGQLEELSGGLFRGRAAVEVHAYELFVHGQAGAKKRVLVAAIAIARRGDRMEVAEEGDAPVAVSDEVLDGLPRTLPVGRADGVRVEEARRAVDEDDRQPGLHLIAQVAVVGAGGHDDQPIDSPQEHGAHELSLAHGVLVEAHGQHGHAALRGRVADGPVDARRERVCHILQQEAQDFRTCRPPSAGWRPSGCGGSRAGEPSAPPGARALARPRLHRSRPATRS